MKYYVLRLLTACFSLKSFVRSSYKKIAAKLQHNVIANDERVIFFPTLGYPVLQKDVIHSPVSNLWNISIHGWIFEPEEDSRKRKAFVQILYQALKIRKSEENQRQVLNRRIRTFLVDNERFKKVQVTLRDQTYVMPRSKKNGHFRTFLLVEGPDPDAMNTTTVWPMEATARDGRVFQGQVYLVPREGISIISDIDDTIKITNVTHKKAMLRNTFLHEFKAVPGISDLYQSWYQNHGASFHYVSSSPWQLYEELDAFCQKSRFPPATFHLKSIRPKDSSILNLFQDPIQSKTRIIQDILDRFPQRSFVLVGDSGEKDPEVYGNMARAYPGNVRAIFIRNVSDEAPTSPRMQEAFRGIEESKWTLFREVEELPVNIGR